MTPLAHPSEIGLSYAQSLVAACLPKLYLTESGPVVSLGEPLEFGTVDVPRFDREALTSAYEPTKLVRAHFQSFCCFVARRSCSLRRRFTVIPDLTTLVRLTSNVRSFQFEVESVLDCFSDFVFEDRSIMFQQNFSYHMGLRCCANATQPWPTHSNHEVSLPQLVQDFQDSLDLPFVVLDDVRRRSPLLRFMGQDLHGCHQAALSRMIEICIGLSKSQAHGSNDSVLQFSVVLCLPNFLARSGNSLFLRLVEAFHDQVSCLDRGHIKKVSSV
jgi:hypothetical protein